MPEHYKALIVVIGITLIAFGASRPLVATFISLQDYRRRRNLWLCLVTAAFLISNFWLYMLVAAALMAFGLRRDPNPAALYAFLLLAVPPFGRDIPTFGLVNQIFPLDYLRLSSMVILLPSASAVLQRSSRPGPLAGGRDPQHRKLLTTDVLVLLFCVLQVALWFPYDSPTATLRRTILLVIDILLPYFVLSRACRSLDDVTETMASLLLAALALGCLAVFETSRNWLLFASLEDVWGTIYVTSFLRRGDTLRAQVTGGHSIVIGYAFVIALGFWVALRTRVNSAGWRWTSLAALVAGLIATMARGPWLGAVAVWLVFLALGPNPVSRLLKTSAAVALAGGLLLLTPWGAGLIDRLPFIGTQVDGSVAYRQQLAAVSWLLIQQNPFLGTLNFMQYMEELRQGEGIIDLVNAYAGVALAYGLIGLSLFIGFFAVVIVGCLRVVRSLAPIDPAAAQLGAGLAACLAAALLMLATVGMYLSIGCLTWAIAGLTVGYTQLMRQKSAA